MIGGELRIGAHLPNAIAEMWQLGWWMLHDETCIAAA